MLQRDLDGRAVSYTKGANVWRSSHLASAKAPGSSKMRLHLHQGLNAPPTLWATQVQTGESAEILDPNPGLSTFALGAVERVFGQSKEGQRWSGVLYYPVGYTAGEKYPLVIQNTRTSVGEQFSLYGPGTAGLGPGYSGYAAQILSNRQIAVLQLERIESMRLQNGDDPPDLLDTPHEVEIQTSVYLAAVENLAERGIIDRAKVGLFGFSRTGWHMLYALTHSDFPYAAAVVSDNMDGGYLQEMLVGLIGGANHNGAPPIGPGLPEWLRRAPGFNADKLTTPVRLQVESNPIGILYQWEMFSQLKRLGKPVELYVIPDVQHGDHQLQNPRQLVALKNSVVDWFDFWLNGREVPGPEKANQYEKWRALRTLQAVQH